MCSACGRISFDPGDTRDASGSALLTYREAVLQDAPLTYWRLADTDAIARDEMGRLEGSYTGGCTQHVAGALAGDPDPAAHFDGTSCRVDFPDEVAFHGRAPFSLELWVALDVLGGQQPYFMNQIRVAGDPVNGFGMLEGQVAGMTYFERTAAGGNRVTDRYVPTVGVYSHLVGTYDGTNIQLYANGQPVGGPTLATLMLDSTGARAVIGAYPIGTGAVFATGNIDEVAVYGHVLPAGRIELHHRIGTLGPQ